MVKLDKAQIACSNERDIIIMDLVIGDRLGKLIGHKDDINSLIKHGKHLISSSLDATVKVWDYTKNVCLKTFTFKNVKLIYRIVMLDESKIGIAASNSIHICNLLTGVTINTITLWEGAEEEHGENIQICGLIKMNKDLICGAYNVVSFFNLNGELIKDITLSSENVVCLSKLNNFLVAVGTFASNIHVLEFPSGETVRTLKCNEDSTIVISLLTLNELQLASGYASGLIRIWDFQNGNLLKLLNGYTSPVHSIIKLNKRQIASGFKDNSVRIWTI